MTKPTESIQVGFFFFFFNIVNLAMHWLPAFMVVAHMKGLIYPHCCVTVMFVETHAKTSRESQNAALRISHRFSMS